jgi:hypothetical protein
MGKRDSIQTSGNEAGHGSASVAPGVQLR